PLSPPTYMSSQPTVSKSRRIRRRICRKIYEIFHSFSRSRPSRSQNTANPSACPIPSIPRGTLECTTSLNLQESTIDPHANFRPSVSAPTLAGSSPDYNPTLSALRRDSKGAVDVVEGKSLQVPSALSDTIFATTKVDRANGSKHTNSSTGCFTRNAPTFSESRTLNGIRIALKFLSESAQMFPPLLAATNAFASCLDFLETAAKIHKEYQDIAAELEALSFLVMRYLEGSKSFRMSNCVANIANLIEQQAELIKQKHNRVLGGRLIEAQLDQQELIRCYRRIEALFRQLQIDMQLSMWDTINEHLTNARLDGLAPARLATYDSTLSTEINRCFCTAGTRENVLSQLDSWSRDHATPNLYWMNGMAGTGKTTIAASFCGALEERKKLAASFFCTMAAPECRQVKRIIPSIAYQLARYSMPFQHALCEILGGDPDISAKNISKQFERLLKEPLVKVKAAIPDNLVVVIDALDECDDVNGVELLLDMVFKHLQETPLKFFVTSRPKPEIYNKMLPRLPDTQAVFHLHDIESSLVQTDIEIYLRSELCYISPTEEQVEVLVQRSGNLFIYAATLIRYIRLGKRSANPHKRLKSALAMISKLNSVHVEIDTLYLSILESSLDEEGLDAEEAEDAWLVLRTVLCAQEPIIITTLSALCGLDDTERVSFALQSLRSVIHFSESSGLISTLHASFPDFMFDKERSGRFFCNITHQNQLLAQHCFEIMKTQLKFNICDLQSSFVPDHLVDDIESRIRRSISPELYYACRYWGEHLHHTFQSAKLQAMLAELLSNKLLFWMEVMNLNQVMPMGSEILLKAMMWLQQSDRPPSDLDWFTEDSRNFVNSFAANPVSRATPHIYISMLPFCPKSTSVSQQYWKRMKSPMDAKGTGMQSREAAALATWKVGSGVQSVAYSPEGTRIAFGCANGTIGIRNVYDGFLVVGPLEGHTDCVTCIDFSPDGMRVASGSKDSTICIWNAQDGTMVFEPIICRAQGVNSIAFSADGARVVAGYHNHGIEIWTCDVTPSSITGPLMGHIDAVRSVAFSPCGTRIASGSDDNTVRLWEIHGSNNAHTSRVIEGHAGSVLSVVFSSDGKLIASGSEDRTVRIWDALSGILVIDPIKGHSSRVTAISFSPDGSRIASCSCDQTIRVWNARKGTLVDGLFEGHTGYILCVTFSPDGTRMASGSEDCTVRLWNISETGLIIPPSAGHVHRVNSIAISPDGARLASASHDHTVQIWDVRGDKITQNLHEEHADVVRSVAFSSDGKHVASGSVDQTIRIWDIHGEIDPKVLKGHSDVVCAVSFSPDGTHLASGSSDHTIRLWDTLGGGSVLDPIRGHSDIVTAIAFSPDGNFIASGSSDFTIRVWDARDGKPISGPFLGHEGGVASVMFSPNSQTIASGSRDCTTRLWDVRNATLVIDPFQGHTNCVTSVAFSLDGAYIVTGSDDCTVRLWGIDGTLVGTLYGHTDSVQSVVFSPNGLHIFSASWDQNIRIWNIGTMREQTAIDDVSRWIIQEDGGTPFARNRKL
ncbi:unnamed protein product, partial [Rhizoctonia solani]